MLINILKNTYIHTYIHTHTHTHTHIYIYIYIHAKMAEDVYDGIENALNLIVCTAERSGNMK